MNLLSKRFQCVGVKSDGTRCSSEVIIDGIEGMLDADKLVPYPDHPSWPYLCADCANEPPNRGSANTRGIVEERR